MQTGEDKTMSANTPLQRLVPRGWLSWVTAVFGWLLCAAMCLWLTIELEAWPYAYEMFFPAVLLILFCNIFLFLFVAGRWGADAGRLAGSAARICIGEAILLAGMYCLARFCM